MHRSPSEAEKLQTAALRRYTGLSTTERESATIAKGVGGRMGMPPQFPAQKRFEEFVQKYEKQQKEQAEKLRQELQDFRENQKIGLQRYSLWISIAAVVISGGSGFWNARMAVKSLALARRGFVVVKLTKATFNDSPMIFEVRAIPPNPALHIVVRASCATYVENGRQPQQIQELQNLNTYETNATVAPGDAIAFTCYSGTGEQLRAPHGVIQKALWGNVMYSDLGGNTFVTDFCFKESGTSGGLLGTEFVACPNGNGAT